MTKKTNHTLDEMVQADNQGQLEVLGKDALKAALSAAKKRDGYIKNRQDELKQIGELATEIRDAYDAEDIDKLKTLLDTAKQWSASNNKRTAPKKPDSYASSWGCNNGDDLD